MSHPNNAGNDPHQPPFYQYDPAYGYPQQQPQPHHHQPQFTGQNGMISPPIFQHYPNQPSTNHQFQQNFQSFQHLNQNQSHLHSQHFHSNYPASNPYQFNTMQSPPMNIGSPNQSFSNMSNGQINPALSPGANMGSPMGFSNGSPMVRGTPDGSQRGSSVSNEVRSPHPPTPQPPVHNSLPQQSPGSVHSSSATPASHLDQSFQSPHSALTNGPSSVVSSPPKSVEPPPSPHIPIEEPLPQFPSPEEIESMASQTRPMIPAAVINRIFAKAGVSFVDPKIGNLIALSSQYLINDIVQDAMSYVKEQGKPSTILTREALEKAMQDRGTKQLPVVPLDSLR